MGKAVKVTNLFTKEETTYDNIESFRQEAKRACDASLVGLIDMMSDAYADGRAIGTYEWLLGVRLDEVG